ncbi:hypothetical protein FJ546_19370 [Mesorhizobium sp. B2-4-19]|uniref:hypothetical protein n=1 Tax=Mesorhizobium sp. B2-4-19 TaxID=2589930 RepID=UPI0011278405|nr:hypothetical protein [Mesorhizobium sp. B2-4-19]TPK60534.1 hypothetical protein FJ546_19370 [Mesorhizobium sp. B2-4-19]
MSRNVVSEGPNSVPIAFSDSAASERLVDISSTSADIGLDAAITSGALDGVPFFGAITGIARAGIAIRDYLFLKKVAAFLETFDKTPLEKRRAFIADLEKKGKKAEFGEQILLLVDRMEDVEKPAIVAHLIAAAAMGHLPLDKALRVAKIVDRAFVEDLKTLPRFQAGSPTNRLVADALFSVGLLNGNGLAMFDGDDADRSGTTYHLNEYGRILVRYGLQVEAS